MPATSAPAALQQALKAVANPARLQILRWLERPRESFGRQDVGDFDTDGVCVSLIQKKAGLSQSTTSAYLATLARAGLVEVKRIGQWTYYRRNEAAIGRFLGHLAEALGEPDRN
jgi:ArsR family transcriptional regulator